MRIWRVCWACLRAISTSLRDWRSPPFVVVSFFFAMWFYFLRLFVGKRQQGNVPCPLDGHSQSPLVFGTGAGLTAGANTAEFIHITAQHFMLFIINHLHIVGAKIAGALSFWSSCS
jgi:hypothetical protein